jgi:hypothetical protein
LARRGRDSAGSGDVKGHSESDGQVDGGTRWCSGSVLGDRGERNGAIWTSVVSRHDIGMVVEGWLGSMAVWTPAPGMATDTTTRVQPRH